MMGLVPAEVAAVGLTGALFGFEISLCALGFPPGGDAAALVLGLRPLGGEPDPLEALTFDAGLSEELPEEDSLDGDPADRTLSLLVALSTVSLISVELDLLLESPPTVSSSPSFVVVTFSLGLLASFSPLTDPTDSLPFLEPTALEAPAKADEDEPDRRLPVSAPIWLHVFASMANGLDLESS